MTTWHADVRAKVGAGSLTDDQADALTAALPGFPLLQHSADSRLLALRFQVEANNVQAATTTAFDVSHEALNRAGIQLSQLSGIQVLSDDDLAAELGPPDDIIGYTEIGEILGVSRQRAQQIAAGNATFPRPVATPLAGTFYSRAAVLAFKGTWPRRRTGRPVSA